MMFRDLKIQILLILLLFYSFITICNTNKSTISGYIQDAETGEALIGATISTTDFEYSSISNNYGFYSITLPMGEHNLFYSFIGFETLKQEMILNSDTIINFSLKRKTLELNEAIISIKNKKAAPSVYKKLTIQQIKELPTVFGEPDLVKALQLKPGIKNMGDGSSGLYVRGGNRDQNYVLIDEAPVYNISHLIGFVSIFNPEMINDIKLFNGYIPPNYGGRISSIIDTKMKEGNLNNYSFTTAVSPLAGRVSVEGPVKAGKASFFVSGRKSSTDLFIKPSKDNYLVPGFYDYNFKLNIRANTRNRIFLTFYRSDDVIETYQDFYDQWDNTISTFRWNHVYSPKAFSNMSIIFSNYNNELTIFADSTGYSWQTGVNDFNYKYDFNWYLNPNNKIGFGLHSIYHNFIPGESGSANKSMSRSNACETSIYLLHNVILKNYLKLDYGVRCSAFLNTGKATWYAFDKNYAPVQKYEEGKGEIWNTYIVPEPRFNLTLNISSSRTFDVAYSRMSQFIQVLSNNTLSYTLFETWLPSSKNVKPLISDNFSIGYFSSKNGIEFDIEAYYKFVKNQVDYVDHASLMDNPYIEGELRKGKANAYGAEFSLTKTEGKTTGSISYVYSKVYYNIRNVTTKDVYVAPYDIPHDIKIQLTQRLFPQIKFSLYWTYTSGRPATFPIGYYYRETDADFKTDNKIPIYSGRNRERFPDYHRLDVAFIFNSSEKRKVKHNITLGLYNVYARKNPLGYNINPFLLTSQQETAMVYHFYSIIPNLSYTLKFN